MAHFAKLGSNGKVIQVLTLDNKDMLNADGVEDESEGKQYLQLHNNWPAEMWIQTSYNTAGGQHKLGGTPFRGNYAGIGYEWDEDNNIFWPKKPYPSWVKDIPTANWKAPVDQPSLTAEQETQNNDDPDNYEWRYEWDEDNQSWNLTNRMA